jgi:hypothetical protein
MLAMPERAKVFAQSRRAATMPTFARLFTRETPKSLVSRNAETTVPFSTY